MYFGLHVLLIPIQIDCEAGNGMLFFFRFTMDALCTCEMNLILFVRLEFF